MTFSVFCIVITIFITLDSIDSWSEDEVDAGLMAKSIELTQSIISAKGELTSLPSAVSTSDFKLGLIGRIFIAPYLSSDEYIQIWENQTLKLSSASMSAFSSHQLIHPQLVNNTVKTFHTVLPDGRAGRAIVSRFSVPQANTYLLDSGHSPKILTLSIVIPIEELDELFDRVEVVIQLGLVFMLILVRLLVVHIIELGFAPMNKLNQHLKTLDAKGQLAPFPQDDNETEELLLIKAELNNFIKLNQQHLDKEKRITADIAHELKTPLTELINLSEMRIRYPDDNRISQFYQKDVLDISIKMKDIINGLLLLQRASADTLSLNKVSLELPELLALNIKSLQPKYPDAAQRITINHNISPSQYRADAFSLNTIFSNLLDNALYYSPVASAISLTMYNDPLNNICIAITNELNHNISQGDLDNLTKPLFQIDESRTNPNRHGLGLSIVENIARSNGFSFNFMKVSELKIRFMLTLPHQ
ncbi:sensor histidine kinase [Shewanella sp.]|uniref:sensor histidine kinase n=1 Tax=Shewanella sp. TaxID=50422 RepID=UPI004053E895